MLQFFSAFFYCFIHFQVTIRNCQCIKVEFISTHARFNENVCNGFKCFIPSRTDSNFMIAATCKCDTISGIRDNLMIEALKNKTIMKKMCVRNDSLMDTHTHFWAGHIASHFHTAFSSHSSQHSYCCWFCVCLCNIYCKLRFCCFCLNINKLIKKNETKELHWVYNTQSMRESKAKMRNIAFGISEGVKNMDWECRRLKLFTQFYTSLLSLYSLGCFINESHRFFPPSTLWGELHSSF